MQIVLEAQHAVGHSQPRGVGHYSINLIQSLLRRNMFDYKLTFFDYKKEVGNRERANKLFGEFGAPFYECNDLDYRVASRDDGVWKTRSYNGWTQTKGDVYHFMCPVSVPTVLDGKMIVTIHDVSWLAYPGKVSPNATMLHNIGIERIAKVKPHIIADSESAKGEILQYISGISPESISVVYLSYDEDNLFRDNRDVCDIVDGDFMFFVGTIENKKNIIRIVKAFEVIAAKNKEIRLVIAGKPTWDDTSEIYNTINYSSYRSRIITPGYITVEQKRRLYSNALCFVFPSICEGFGIPVLEAMACGCPVITSDNTSLPEVGGEAAVYVNAYSTEQLACEMERVITSESLRKDMIAKGFVQAKKFSWDKTAEQVEHVYRLAMSK